MFSLTPVNMDGYETRYSYFRLYTGSSFHGGASLDGVSKEFLDTF
ncbi:MAG: hypothetical protein QXH73_04880 [Ignisphaera sp.]